jgi:hypothetical protein
MISFLKQNFRNKVLFQGGKKRNEKGFDLQSGK